MLKRLIFSGLIFTILLSSCGVYEYLGRKTAQGEILGAVKQNGLLVRLRSEDAKIKAMRAYGKEGKANEMEAEIEHYNNMLIQTMNEAYDFSEVYYYYSHDAEAIFKEGDSSKIMNQELQPSKFSFTGKIGVLLGERYELNLHKWEHGGMIPLDKMVYPRYKARTVSFVFKKPTIAEVMSIGIPLMNRDFTSLYGS